MFIVLVPAIAKTDSEETIIAINKAGFVSLVVVQCAVDLALLLALDHEQRFRSSGNNDISLFKGDCTQTTIIRITCAIDSNIHPLNSPVLYYR